MLLCVFFYLFFPSLSVSQTSSWRALMTHQVPRFHSKLDLNLTFFSHLACGLLVLVLPETKFVHLNAQNALINLPFKFLPSSLLNLAATKFADLLGSVRRGSGPTSDGEGRSSTPPPAVLSAPSPPHTPVVPMQSK